MPSSVLFDKIINLQVMNVLGSVVLIIFDFRQQNTTEYFTNKILQLSRFSLAEILCPRVR
jgi:hypothetical protein